MGNWNTQFGHGPMRALAEYVTTYNMASQTIAVDNANTENIQSTGTGACVINGVLINSLTADAELDISADTTAMTTGYSATNAVGTTLADDYERFYCVLADADGTLSIWLAGDAAAIGGSAVCKIPAFDPNTYVCVATILYANDAASASVTVGTDTDWGTDGTFYQMIGPVFPHPDNIDWRN